MTNLANLEHGRAAYVAKRKAGLGAVAAKAAALAAIEAGRRFYSPAALGAIWAPAGEGAFAGAAIRERRKVWIEDPAALGLRFVGFSDELPGGPSHTGHYSDCHQDEVYRGAVWQWPARNGESLYVYGYREGNESRRHGWRDTAHGREAGAGLLFFGDMVKGDKGGREKALPDWRDNDSDLRDCASWADSEADSAADDSRDYSEAWQAGSEAADMLEEAQKARQSALALIREAKSSCPALAALGPAMRAAIGESIREHVEAWQEAKAKAAAAFADIPASLESAFLEGASRQRGGLFR